MAPVDPEASFVVASLPDIWAEVWNTTGQKLASS
jgi:hypothetical protein